MFRLISFVATAIRKLKLFVIQRILRTTEAHIQGLTSIDVNFEIEQIVHIINTDPEFVTMDYDDALSCASHNIKKLLQHHAQRSIMKTMYQYLFEQHLSTSANLLNILSPFS